MHIRMPKFGNLVAVAALPAGIAVVATLAVQILKEGYAKGKGPAAIVLIEQDGVRDVAAVGHPLQRPLD